MGELKLKMQPQGQLFVAANRSLMESYLLWQAAQGQAGIWDMHFLSDQKDLLPIKGRREPHVLIIDQAFLSLLTPEVWAHVDQQNVILLIDRGLEETIKHLKIFPGLAHVQVKNDSLFSKQLHLTIKQILFGAASSLSDYLAPGAVIIEDTMKKSSQRQECIGRILQDVDHISGFTELRSTVATVATELLMNATFNAPHDLSTMKPKYKDIPRQNQISLHQNEEIKISHGYDRELFCLSVTDNFGMLNREVLIDNLVRAASGGGTQVQMQTPGAGVGLYMVLSLVNTLDIYVKNGESTQITAIIGISKRYIDFERRGQSLNLFIDGK
jgi:hypothetical protein